MTRRPQDPPARYPAGAASRHPTSDLAPAGETIVSLFGEAITAADATAPRVPPPPADDDDVRARVLADVRSAGALGRTVTEVAAVLHLRRAVAYGHLEALYRAELITRAGVRGDVGRPSVVFVATARGNE